MTQNEIRNLVEDVTNIAVGKMIGPIDRRLIKIETQLEITNRRKNIRRESMWKIITVGMALPACIYGASKILNLF